MEERLTIMLLGMRLHEKEIIIAKIIKQFF